MVARSSLITSSGFQFQFLEIIWLCSLGIQPISFYKRKSDFKGFFSDSLAYKGKFKEDRGMQNHLADSILSGCTINLIIKINFMRQRLRINFLILGFMDLEEKTKQNTILASHKLSKFRCKCGVGIHIKLFYIHTHMH